MVNLELSEKRGRVLRHLGVGQRTLDVSSSAMRLLFNGDEPPALRGTRDDRAEAGYRCPASAGLTCLPRSGRQGQIQPCEPLLQSHICGVGSNQLRCDGCLVSRPFSGLAQTCETSRFPGCDSPVAPRVGVVRSLLRLSDRAGKSGEDLLQVHHLAGDVFGDGEGDDLGRTVDVGDHAACFCTGEAAEVGAQTQLDSFASIVSTSKWMATLVAPLLSGAGGLQYVWSEDGHAPLLGDWRQHRIGPVKQANERDPIGSGRGRQYLEELLVAVTDERGDDHGVEAGIGGLTRAMSGWESIQMIARSSPCLLIRYENGAMLTQHSPPSVVMRAGSCSGMIPARCAAAEA
jgi:hypothetical protein